MKLILKQLAVCLFIMSTASIYAQTISTAPENVTQLATRMATERIKMAPFLQSLPTKLNVRKKMLLSDDNWVKRFEVAPKTKTTGIPQPAWEKQGVDETTWEKTSVPEWNYTRQNHATPVSCILWYRKAFNAAKVPAGKRVFIVFEGVDWEAEVWLNGQKLGSHFSYFEPFRFDVTDILSPSGKNTLAVRVIDGLLYGEPASNWGPFPMPPAKDQHYVRDRSKSLGGFKKGDMHIGSGYGIFGDVYLETTGSSSISNLLVRGYTAKDEAVVQVFTDVKDKAPSTIKVELLSENFKGETFTQVTPFKTGKGIVKQTLTVKIPNARRWSSENPWLYRCRVTLLDAKGAVIDSQDALFGHRTIEMVSSANPKEGIQEGTLLLDGKPLFLRGTSIQGLNALEFWGQNERLHDVILLLKAGDFNAIRSCQHIQFPGVRALLDRYGIMSQQDVGSRYPTRPENPSGIRIGLIKACGIIPQVLYNNPGVVLLSLTNECEYDPTEMVTAALAGDSERLLIPISGRLNRIRPEQFPKWVKKKYYSWHHTYAINKDAWKGKLPEPMRAQVLDSIHPYWGWYPEKGQIYNWCRIQVPGRMLQVGEFGSEALDGYETMKDYPAEWGKTPAKSDDVLWGHVQTEKADIRQVVGFRGKKPTCLIEYINASQTYQSDQLSQMTKAWRLSPTRIAAYFQFHFIDVLAANWPKSIVSHDLTPKKAYFAMAQVNQPLVPLPRVLAGGNKMEVWVANHKEKTYKNALVEWTATSEGKVLAKGSEQVDITKFGTSLAGIADLSTVDNSVNVMDLRLILKDSNGNQLSTYTQEIYIHAWRAAVGAQFPFRKKTTVWMEAEAGNYAKNGVITVDKSKRSVTSVGEALSLQPEFHPKKVCAVKWNFRFQPQKESHQLWVRHAGDKPVKIQLQINDKSFGVFTLANTKGWGYKKDQWAWTAIALPDSLVKGVIAERNDFQEADDKKLKVRFEILNSVNVNLDCIVLASSKLKQPADTQEVKLVTANKASSFSAYSSFYKMAAATDSVLPPLKAITKGPKNHWFGYYLHEELDASGRYLLACQLSFENRLPKPTDAIKVGMIDLEDNNKWIELGESKAWSWQQSCFLQWRPSFPNEVVWNDREGNTAVARVLNLKTKKIRTLPRAIDEAISPDGKWALCSDFSRTWRVSPGYGYPGIENASTKINSPKGAGIWKMNMETGKTELLVSLADLKNLPGNKKLKDKFYRYVAHFDWSPDGKRFSAFYRGHWTEGTRVYTIAADGSDIRLLSGNGASHWAWRDNENVLIWTHKNGKDVGYQLYKDDNSGKPKSLVWKAPNGHQTYIPGTNNEWIVTDSYPQGSERKQILHLVHIPTKTFIPLAKLASPKEYKSNWRSDMHPRITRDGKKVFIDSPHDGGRQIYMVDIDKIISKTTVK